MGGEWWALRGSNPRPSRCKRDALPTELSALAAPFGVRFPTMQAGSERVEPVLPQGGEIVLHLRACFGAQAQERTAAIERVGLAHEQPGIAHPPDPPQAPWLALPRRRCISSKPTPARPPVRRHKDRATYPRPGPRTVRRQRIDPAAGARGSSFEYQLQSPTPLPMRTAARRRRLGAHSRRRVVCRRSRAGTVRERSARLPHSVGEVAPIRSHGFCRGACLAKKR